MTTRQPYIDLFDIDEGTSKTPPRRQTNAQHGTAYVWHSTTQELIPILPPDHPNYKENRAFLMAAFRQWNGGTSK